MKIITSIFIFVLGACLGSFYACIGYRIPNKISLLYPKSHCEGCKKTLKWYMNIPLFSYIFLKGKCEYCNKKISKLNFIIELFTSISFTLSYLLLDFNIYFLIIITLISALSITLVTDIKYYYISDRVVIISIILVLLIKYLFKESITSSIVIGIVMFIFMYLIKLLGDKLFKKESLGGGDIKLMTLVGVTLGNLIYSFTSLFISCVIALIYSLFNKNKDNIIPFGPFILIGLIITYIVNIIYGVNLL